LNHAKEKSLKYHCYIPDYKLHGKKAPFVRNKIIVSASQICIAFWDGVSKGTEYTVGLALKQGLTVLNTPGTVDAGYDGEVKVIVYNTNNYTVTIPKGMKIAQAVLCPVLNGKFVTLHEVIELDEKERGSNGFGSTGI
jgi:dUTP pyrophosphatase